MRTNMFEHEKVICTCDHCKSEIFESDEFIMTEDNLIFCDSTCLVEYLYKIGFFKYCDKEDL